MPRGPRRGPDGPDGASGSTRIIRSRCRRDPASRSRPRARRTPHEARPLAVRLQLKLGAVTEQDRLPDSPDTVVVVEPAVGIRRAHQGQPVPAGDLTGGRQPGARGDPDGRRHDPQRVLLRRVRRDPAVPDQGDGVANKRLAHQRDKYGLGHGDGRRGPDRRGGRGRPRPRAVRRRRWARPRRTSSARPACPPCRTRTASAASRPRTSSPRSGAASSTSATRCASSRPTS